MEILFVILLLFHGTIHLMGFIKAFSTDSLPDLKLTVSGPAGFIWLTTFLAYLVVAALFLFDAAFWWAPGIAAVLLSQGLVITAWRDAKFATIPNLIILVVSVIAGAGWLFDRSVDADINRVISSPEAQIESASGNNFTGLPLPVRRWLEASGAAGHSHISDIRLSQAGEMKTEPGGDWSKTEARQVFNADIPAFVWSVDMEMMPGVTVSGRDLFLDGKGHMLIKLYSLIPVVDEKGDKIDSGTLQRFLSEIVWFPTAALNNYITWHAVDSTSARATMSWKGLAESVTFHFSENRDVAYVTANRYMGGGEDAERRPWKVTVLKTDEVEGLRIPTDLEVSWELESGPFTWYRFKVTDVEFNLSDRL